jgi:RNA polymerase-binding transcription factor DksA
MRSVPCGWQEETAMAQFDAAGVRQRLVAERERLEHDIYERTEGSEVVLAVNSLADSGGMASDQADDAGALSDAERNSAILRNSQVLLDQVLQALARLDAGTYGICVRCGREINPRRLEVLPYVTLCVDCQSAVDLRGGR